jgi:hypothetical protein
MTDLEACAYAADLLKQAGFEHRYTSMKSEACYYGLPGREEVIRIAAHAHGHGDRALMPIIVRLTFAAPSAESLSVHKSWDQVDNRVANALGYYVLRCAKALPHDAKERKDRQYRAKKAAYPIASKVAVPLPARDAIAAIREPTVQMLDAMRTAASFRLDLPNGIAGERAKYRLRWQAGIDVALGRVER